MPMASGHLEREGLVLTWGASTDTGKVRKINEDSFLAEPGLFVVADGMGGHQAGDVASRLTVEACQAAAGQVPLLLDQVVALVTESNRRVREHADENGTDGMGTTLVGLVVIDNAGSDSLLSFNVGDSRCYMSSIDGLAQITRDHSVVQEMVTAGEITEEEALHHRERNVVTRAIGVEAYVAADFVVIPRVSPARILLCSDGVSGELTEAQIAEILASNDPPGEVAETVVRNVLLGRAADNATAVVIDIEWAELPTEIDSRHPDVITGPRPTLRDSNSHDTMPRSARFLPTPDPASDVVDVEVDEPTAQIDSLLISAVPFEAPDIVDDADYGSDREPIDDVPV
jgi:PPM family protein phosphatase